MATDTDIINACKLYETLYEKASGKKLFLTLEHEYDKVIEQAENLNKDELMALKERYHDAWMKTLGSLSGKFYQIKTKLQQLIDDYNTAS